MTIKAHKTLRSKEGGFTLIETMIALAIFAIGILGVAQLQMWNVKNNTTGNITTQATMLARAKLEDLKSRPFSDAELDPAGNTHQDPNNPVDHQGNPGGIYTRVWDITDFGDGDSRQIEMRVSWNRRGQNRTIVLTTLTKGI